MAVASGLVALAFTRVVRADPPPQQHVDVVARLSGFTGSRAGGGLLGLPDWGSLLGLQIDYRLTAAGRVGAYADYSAIRGVRALRFGARAEWHGRPAEVVDPWLGASLGGLGYTKGHAGWGADTEVDVGLDFHIGRNFAIGISEFVIIPIVNGTDGVEYSGLPFIPPALRLVFTI